MFILGIDDHGLSNIYKLSFKTMCVGEKHLLCVNDKECIFLGEKKRARFSSLLIDLKKMRPIWMKN